MSDVIDIFTFEVMENTPPESQLLLRMNEWCNYPGIEAWV